jgi:hypothetical protein
LRILKGKIKGQVRKRPIIKRAVQSASLTKSALFLSETDKPAAQPHQTNCTTHDLDE